MTTSAPGLAEMNARMQQWMNEKPTGNFNNTTELRINQNDMVIFQFASSGADGDRLIKAYRSHIFGLISKNNKRYNETRYCAVQNGEGQECMFCNMGHTDIKERMSMWLLVHQILHASLPQPQQGQPMPDWPVVNYEGNNYYMEQVNAWKIWHTSAWRESPWSDICRAASLYQSLHNFTAEILCTGSGMNKRFKFIVLPNSAALPNEYYQQAWSSLEPIPDMLRAEMSRQIAQNPQPAGGVWSDRQQIATNFVPGGVPMGGHAVAWQPPAAPAPTLAVPMTIGAPPLAVAAPPPPATFQPGGVPAAAAPIGGVVSPPMAPPAAPPQQPPAAPPAEPIQAVAAPVAPPAPPAAPVPPVAPPAVPAIPAQPPALPATPPPAPPTAPPTGQVEQAPDDGRRPMRRMF